jgi:hypothetical protein
MTSKNLLGVVLAGVLLIGGPLTEPLLAQDAKRVEGGSKPNGSEIAYEWQYSCPDSKACSFTCPSSGGASGVTKLSIQLMTIPLGTTRVAGVFYDFSTVAIPRANGFSITTGISTVACQINGMTLDYAGSPNQNQPPSSSPKQHDSPAATSSLSRPRERRVD